MRLATFSNKIEEDILQSFVASFDRAGAGES
jgi:hypothetical protein